MPHNDKGLVSLVQLSILYIEWVMRADDPYIAISVVFTLEALHLQCGGRV